MRGNLFTFKTDKGEWIEGQTMNKVFNYICYRCIEKSAYDYIEVVSVPEIAEELNYSENFVRKYIKKLKELNLIKSICESGYDERREKYVIVRGYKPSEKGRETDTYLKQLKIFISNEKCGEK